MNPLHITSTDTGPRRSLDVLIVEDEALLAQAEAESLRHRGHRVTIAGTALEALQHPNPDVVVTDLRLPVVSGVELLGLLIARDPETPVILTSGSFVGLDQRALKASGAYRILPKPFAFTELIEVVEAAGSESTAPLERLA